MLHCNFSILHFFFYDKQYYLEPKKKKFKSFSFHLSLLACSLRSFSFHILTLNKSLFILIWLWIFFEEIYRKRKSIK